MYNAELINAALSGRRKMAEACRDCAKQFSTIELPESVYQRISTRKKLYNFLEALDLDAKSIMKYFKIPVPRDTRILERSRKDKDSKPGWLSGQAIREEITEFLF